MNKRNWIYLAASICILMFAIQVIKAIRERVNRSDIRDNMVLVNGGRIVKITPLHESAVRFIEYAYFVEGRKYSGRYPYGLGFNGTINPIDFDIIYRKSIPVVIEKSRPSNSVMLLNPKEYKEYGLHFPDTLTWILHLLEK